MAATGAGSSGSILLFFYLCCFLRDVRKFIGVYGSSGLSGLRASAARLLLLLQPRPDPALSPSDLGHCQAKVTVTNPRRPTPSPTRPPSLGFQLTGPKTVFSTPIGTDVSLGHLVAGLPLVVVCGWGSAQFYPLYCSCFYSSSMKNQPTPRRHLLTRLEAKGAHLVAHDLACHYPSAPAANPTPPPDTTPCSLNNRSLTQPNQRRQGLLSGPALHPHRGDMGVTDIFLLLLKKWNE